MFEDEERNWKAEAEARAANASQGLWRQCASSACVAVFIAPLAMFTTLGIQIALEEGGWPTNLHFAELVGGLVPFYGVSLLVSLPASIPCAIVFAIATYKLRRAGYLNWLTSTIIGACMGMFAGLLLNQIFTTGKSPLTATLSFMAFMAPVGALTTLATYQLCLRRA
jgi:hypothetical protein